MTTAHKVTVALALVLAVIAVWAIYSFVQEHEAHAVLAVQQKAEQDKQAAIADKEKENQATLASTLKQYADMKLQVQTPQQVAQALPQIITLPTPMQQITTEQAQAAATIPDAPKINAGDLIIPASDAKAFYDSQLTCKANEAKLSSCQQTVTNQQDVMASKDTEISEQATALKGGTKGQLVKSAAKWLIIGGVAGYFAHKR